MLKLGNVQLLKCEDFLFSLFILLKIKYWTLRDIILSSGKPFVMFYWLSSEWVGGKRWIRNENARCSSSSYDKRPANWTTFSCQRGCSDNLPVWPPPGLVSRWKWFDVTGFGVTHWWPHEPELLASCNSPSCVPLSAHVDQLTQKKIMWFGKTFPGHGLWGKADSDVTLERDNLPERVAPWNWCSFCIAQHFMNENILHLNWRWRAVALIWAWAEAELHLPVCLDMHCPW